MIGHRDEFSHNRKQQKRATRIYWSALLIVRSRGQRRKGRSRLSRAWAEERPGRMRHGSWGRAHGWASVPPTASQTIAASSVDAAWGSGHHHETRMRGTRSVPPQTRHQLPCGSMRTQASPHHMRMSHTGPNTHPPGGRGEHLLVGALLSDHNRILSLIHI